jgi:hypothetical protein
VQLTCIAAHVGTATGLGGEDGDGVGLGVGLAVGVGLGVGLGLADAWSEGEGLPRATSGPFAVQPVTASSTPASTSPLLTGLETLLAGPALRGISFSRKRPE